MPGQTWRDNMHKGLMPVINRAVKRCEAPFESLWAVTDSPTAGPTEILSKFILKVSHQF
jgi:hypothetical protein